MKTAWLKMVWAAGALFAATATAHADPPRGDIFLSVATGGKRGTVVCGLYDRGGWLKRPLRRTTASANGNVATCRFDGLAPGTYAAGAFQDQNANGKLDRGWTGLPKEPWCVSRGPRGTLGPPPFEAAKFALSAGTVKMSCSAR